MLIAVVAVAWLAGVTLTVALRRAAGRAERAMERVRGEGRG